MLHDNDNELPRTRAEAKAKGLKRYHTGQPCKYGHVADRLVSNHSCVECQRLRRIEWERNNPEHIAAYRKKMYAENKDDVLANWSAWYSDNRKDQLVKKRARYQKNRDKELAYAKRYRAKNRDRILDANKKWKEQNPEKVKSDWDAWYAANGKTWGAARRAVPRNKIDSAISRGIHESIGDKKAGRSWESLVGYTVDELMRHLEKLFLPGMTFDNYGKGGWHIDHKVPKSVHNYTSPEHSDFKRCWGLKNLQPLWERDNLVKHAKLEAPFQPSLAIH